MSIRERIPEWMSLFAMWVTVLAYMTYIIWAVSNMH